MNRRLSASAAGSLLAIVLMAGCASRPSDALRPVIGPPESPQAPTPAAEPLAAPPGKQEQDPAATLIAASQAHFAAGERELQLGHLDRARVEFNRAIDVLLESPEGALASPAVQEQFIRLIERISAYEFRALAQGDGFSEEPEPPASLDELLAISTFDLPDAKPELRSVVELDLNATTHDIPIPLNGKVLAYIELFQGRLRDWFQAALQRGQSYLPMIEDALRSEGLPLDLAYVPIVESAFHTTATSRARARGVWQLMRGTAVELGLKYDWYIDERAHPERATAAAIAYLKRLNQMFGGDWHLTLASYNGGPGTVQRAMKRRGIEDFWALTAAAGRTLPRETREYVPMVLAAIVVARNPAQYGFVVEPASPEAPETVAVPGPVDLRRIAEWAGVPVDEIRRLNPELRRMTTPLRGEQFALRVPAGTGAQVAERLALAAPEELVALQFHTVKRGESLATIANKLRVRRADLAEANYLTLRSRVRPGDRLVIPRASAPVLAVRADASTPPVPVLATSPPNARSSQADLTRVTYRVKKGDTLYAIARAFGTTVDALREWNDLSSSRIAPGDRLTVYTAKGPGTNRP